MKKKEYLGPTVDVVELKQQQHLLAGSGTGASMPGTFTEEDWGGSGARMFDFEDDFVFEEDDFKI